jgi:hypothetical protein
MGKNMSKRSYCIMSLASHRIKFDEQDTKKRPRFVSTVPLRSQYIIHHVLVAQLIICL